MEYIKITKKSVKAARKLLKKAYDYANEFPNFTAKDVFWMWDVASTILHDEGIKEVNFGKNKYGGKLQEVLKEYVNKEEKKSNSSEKKLQKVWLYP